MKNLPGLAILGLLLLIGISPGHAAPHTFFANLNGDNENPLIVTAGDGTAKIIFDDTAHTLSIDVTFVNLTSFPTAAHIHCCIGLPGNLGVATMSPSLTGFPIFTRHGAYSQVFDTTLASTFNTPFIDLNGGTVAGAEAALLAGLWSRQAYFNIHTTFQPGGEIGGFLTPFFVEPPILVPEPRTFGLLLLGLGALGVRGMRRSL